MDLDVTLLFQTGIFLFLLVTLNGLLWKPLMGLMEARHAKLEGLREESTRLGELGRREMEAYQARIREARDQAQRERDALRTAGRDEERRLLGDTRAEINRVLTEARDKIATQERDAKKALAPDVEALAQRMVEKVVGQKLGGAR